MNITQAPNEQSNLFTVGDQDFEALVLRSTLPVVVDFWAQWCPHCHTLAPVYQRLSVEYQGKLRFAKLDIDEHQHIPVRFGVQAAPTLLLFQNGKEHSRIVGPHPTRLKRFLDGALAETGSSL